jgi:hypothetical protein
MDRRGSSPSEAFGGWKSQRRFHRKIIKPIDHLGSSQGSMAESIFDPAGGGDGEMTWLSEMEYPHWLMVAGALLVVAGFIGLGFSRYMNPAAENNLHPAAAPNSSVEEEEVSARHSSAGLWKPADDDQLREMAASGKSPSEIARLLHRSPSAVRKRASLLGITVQLVDAKGK